METNEHLGELIRKRVAELKLSSPNFAKQMGYNPAGISRFFYRTDFTISQLKSISEILKYNFFQHFVEFPENPPKELLDTLASLQQRVKELEKENERLTMENTYMSHINEILAGKNK